MNTVQDISWVHFADGFCVIAGPLNSNKKKSAFSLFSSMSGGMKGEKVEDSRQVKVWCRVLVLDDSC